MDSKKNQFDVIVIGSGMAGLSIASNLSKEVSVCILEKERIPSYHSTGRSFAFYIESYGNNIVRKLTSSSKDFFLKHSQSTVSPLLKPRGLLHIATKKQDKFLNQMYDELIKTNKRLNLLNSNEILKIVPCLNSQYVFSAIQDQDASDIDVNGLYNIYFKKFNKNKGSLFTDIKIDKFIKNNNNWSISTNQGNFFCELIINAAGAWCDEVGAMVNAQKIGLMPKKRTVFCFKPNNLSLENNWPLVVDIEENFYFKVENETVLASPADETDCLPHDAYPDEIDLALGAERIKKATNFKFNNINNKWAGLRNFVNDKTPVIGFDSKIENFFWLAGQGGYGIQVAPALAKIASNIILNKSNDYYENKYNIDINLLDVKRLL